MHTHAYTWQDEIKSPGLKTALNALNSRQTIQIATKLLSSTVFLPINTLANFR